MGGTQRGDGGGSLLWNWFQKLCVSFVQANFARNICNISFPVFYVAGLFARKSCFAIFDQNFAGRRKKVGRKFCFPPTSSYILTDRCFLTPRPRKGCKSLLEEFPCLQIRCTSHQHKGLILLSKDIYKFIHLWSRNISDIDQFSKINISYRHNIFTD